MRCPAGLCAKAQSHSTRVRGTKAGLFSPKTALNVAMIPGSSPGRNGRNSYLGAAMASAQRVAARVVPVLEEPAHDRRALEAAEAQELARAVDAEAAALQRQPLGRGVGHDQGERAVSLFPRARRTPGEQRRGHALLLRTGEPVEQPARARHRITAQLALDAG